MKAADAKTDPIDLVTRTSPAPGAAVARPLSAPTIARRRGRGYELAPPSPRDLIARSIVPVLPAGVRPPANRAARRRYPRPVQRVGSAVAALLAAPLLASALPVGQLAASAGPTVATTTTTPTTTTTIASDPAATTDPSGPTTSVDPTATTPAGAITDAPTTVAVTPPSATAPATTPVATPVATTTTTSATQPGTTTDATSVPAPTSGTTAGVRPGSTTTTAVASTTTTTTVDEPTTTSTTVPVAAATTAMPVGEVVLPPLGTSSDPVAVAAAQAIGQRHTDEQAQIELLWTQTAREAADQDVARLTARVADLSGQAFALAAAGQPTFAVERDRAEAQVALDEARRNAATMTLRQASAAAVAEQSAAAYATTRRTIADAVALRAGVDAAQLDARWVTTSGARLDVVFAALSQLGDPYVWGTTGPDTFDCSGLTGFAWKAAGIDLPHYTVWQRQTTLDVAQADLQPGDLVFNLAGPNGGHVMMFLGLGQAIVEAPAPGLTVIVSNWRSTTGFGSPLDDRIVVRTDTGGTTAPPPAAATPGA